MTDYTDYEQWLEAALFDALIVLRKTDTLREPGHRKKLYDSLDRIRQAESGLRAFWEEPKS